MKILQILIINYHVNGGNYVNKNINYLNTFNYLLV